MAISNTGQIGLIRLLKIAISNDNDVSSIKYFDAETDWNAILFEAKRHSVIGIAFQGIISLKKQSNLCISISNSLLARWYGLSESIRNRNNFINKQIVKVEDLFRENGFRTVILKGQGNTIYYPSSLNLLRTPGDIDVWVEGGFNRVNAFVQSVSPTSQINEIEMPFNIFPSTIVEVHYKPFFMRHPIKNIRLLKFFFEESENCFNNRVLLPSGQSAVCPTLPFNLVYQLVHIHHHFMTEGVGLRHLIDYFFLLKNTNGKEVKDRVKYVINDLNLERFASALTWIMMDVFGLSRENTYCDPNEKDGRFLLEEICKMGNFGIKSNLNNQSGLISNFLRTFYNVFIRNVRYWRFDYSEVFWGPLWRVFFFIKRKTLYNKSLLSR